MIDSKRGRQIFTSQHELPGQKNMDNLPSGIEKESYRLSTFDNFHPTNFNPCQLAAYGFFFTGFQDKVQCFSCGQTRQDWKPLDDVTLPCLHKANCKFANRTDTSNVSISSLNIANSPSNSQSYSINRQDTLVERSSERSFDPQCSSQSGFAVKRTSFKLIDVEDSVEDQEKTELSKDNPWEEHVVGFLPRYEFGFQHKHIDNVKCLAGPSNGPAARTFSAANPFNSSFNQPPTSAAPHAQTVDLGKSMRWNEEQVKKELQIRPISTNVEDMGIDKVVTTTVNKKHNETNGQGFLNRSRIVEEILPEDDPVQEDTDARDFEANNSIQIIDPSVVIGEISEKVEREMNRLNLYALDLPSKRLKYAKLALRRQYIKHKQFFDTPTELDTAMWEVRNIVLKEKREELRESEKCKKCHRENISMLFIPCGHRVCCTSCAEQIERCAACKEFIGKRFPCSVNTAAQSPV